MAQTISIANDFQILQFKIQKLEGINKRQEDEIKNQKQALIEKDKALEQKDKDFAKILSSMGLSIKQIAEKLSISEDTAKKLTE